MKGESAGSKIVMGIILLLIVWQLVQALWIGRMHDILFDDDEYLFFFESPILFSLQFAGFAAFGYMIARALLKELRKGSGS